MQTDSLLTNLDRARLDRWAGDLEQNKTYCHLGQQLAEIARPIVVELARLEQENQRLTAELNSAAVADAVRPLVYYSDNTAAALDAARTEIRFLEPENHRFRVESDAIKASMLSVLNALKLGDHVRPQSWSEVVSDEIVPAIARLEQENKRLGDCIRSIDNERNDANERCATTRDALTDALAEVQRLRSELEKPHEHSPKIKERQDQLILDGILERMSTLEGRVRGTMEGAKARLDSQESRLSALEEKVNRPNLVQEMTDLQNKQPVQTARNPFEDLRPPRGL